MRIRVHKNLNRDCWSITIRKEPVRHVDAVALTGAEFKVSAAGRERSLRIRKRAVHAWCVGEQADVPEDLGGLVEVSYNPWKAGHFYRRDTGEPVTAAALVVFTTDGRCLCRL